jgi:hypothetical protein
MINEKCLGLSVTFDLLNISTIFIRKKEVFIIIYYSTEPKKKSNCSAPLTYTSAVTLYHAERFAVLHSSNLSSLLTRLLVLIVTSYYSLMVNAFG